jgi:O-antigen/teichoic acid export membrane protein
MRHVLCEHWRYGKWVAAGAGPNWISDNVYFLALPAWFGLAHAGALKALSNLAQPASQSISALGVLLMPILVRERETHGSAGMARAIRTCIILFLAGSLVYLLLLWLFRSQIFQFLYGSKFSEFNGWPLLAASLVPLAQGLPNVAGSALGAIERPQLGFWADSWSAAFALFVGLPLAWWLGAGGALLGTALTYAVMGILTLLAYQRVIRRASAIGQQAVVPGPPDWTGAV